MRPGLSVGVHSAVQVAQKLRQATPSMQTLIQSFAHTKALASATQRASQSNVTATGAHSASGDATPSAVQLDHKPGAAAPDTQTATSARCELGGQGGGMKERGGETVQS